MLFRSEESTDAEVHISDILTIPLAFTRLLIGVGVDAKWKRMTVSSMIDNEDIGGSIQVLVILDWSTDPVRAVNIELGMSYVRFVNKHVTHPSAFQ